MPLITLPNGSQGAIEPDLFAEDPGNTLGMLASPYGTVALAFVYAAGTGLWSLQRTSVSVGNAGDGSVDEDTGFSGTQSQSDTSFLSKGFMSSQASFTVQGHAVAPDGSPYSTAASGSGTSYIVARTGAIRNDCVGIAGELIKAALDSAYWQLFQQSRKCFKLLGLTSQLPAGYGLASQQDTTNGTLGCSQQAQYRRPAVIPPGNTNTPEYIWQCLFGNSLTVPFDPTTAAPADGAICVIKVKVHFQGYFSDKNGVPLVMDGRQADYYESIRANNYTVFA